MTIQLSTAARNAKLDAIESFIGTSPTLEIRSGAVPANCAAADTGTVLATVPLPSDWMAAASGGSKVMCGTWQDNSADATGTAAYYRIKQGGTCHVQGTCTMSGGGGDMILDNTSLAIGQLFTVTSYSWTEANG